MCTAVLPPARPVCAQLDDWLRTTADHLEDQNAKAGWWWSKQVAPATPGKLATGLGLADPSPPPTAPAPEPAAAADLGVSLGDIGSLMADLEEAEDEDHRVSVPGSPAAMAIEAAAGAAEEEDESSPALYKLFVPFCLLGLLLCTLWTASQASDAVEQCGAYYAQVPVFALPISHIAT